MSPSQCDDRTITPAIASAILQPLLSIAGSFQSSYSCPFPSQKPFLEMAFLFIYYTAGHANWLQRFSGRHARRLYTAPIIRLRLPSASGVVTLFQKYRVFVTSSPRQRKLLLSSRGQAPWLIAYYRYQKCRNFRSKCKAVQYHFANGDKNQPSFTTPGHAARKRPRMTLSLAMYACESLFFKIHRACNHVGDKLDAAVCEVSADFGA